MERILWELVEEVGGQAAQRKAFRPLFDGKNSLQRISKPSPARARLPSPTCFDKEIFEVVSQLLQQNISPGRAVRLLGVSASALQSSGWQESLLNRDKRNA